MRSQATWKAARFIQMKGEFRCRLGSVLSWLGDLGPVTFPLPVCVLGKWHSSFHLPLRLYQDEMST